MLFIMLSFLMPSLNQFLQRVLRNLRVMAQQWTNADKDRHSDCLQQSMLTFNPETLGPLLLQSQALRSPSHKHCLSPSPSLSILVSMGMHT